MKKTASCCAGCCNKIAGLRKAVLLFRVDNGYRSRVLFGNWVYDYPEQSADIPGELHQLGEIGWIPVDFTPGFYYNTYALLRMAQLPQNVRKTAALQDEGEEAENVAGNTPQIKQQDQLSEQVRAMYVNVVTGVLLLVLFLFLLFIVVLEAGHLFYEEKIRKMVRQEEKRSTEYLCRQISGNLSVLGIEVRLGWNAAETDRSICNCMPDIEPGIYQRVNYVLEKYVYGTGHLEPEEFRLLGAFLIAIRESRKLTGIRKRFLSRYIVFIRG